MAPGEELGWSPVSVPPLQRLHPLLLTNALQSVPGCHSLAYICAKWRFLSTAPTAHYVQLLCTLPLLSTSLSVHFLVTLNCLQAVAVLSGLHTVTMFVHTHLYPHLFQQEFKKNAALDVLP